MANNNKRRATDAGARGAQPARGAAPRGAAAPNGRLEFGGLSAAQKAERVAKRKRWDLILSSVLLVGLGYLCLNLTYVAVVLSLAPAGCEERNVTCNYDQINTGFAIGLISPTALTVIAVIVTILTYLAGRRAWWVPLAGAALSFGATALATAMVIGGVPGASVL